MSVNRCLNLIEFYLILILPSHFIMKRIQAIRWCFTINNYNNEEIESVKRLDTLCNLIICEKEVGEQGTPHLQGYLEMKKRIDGNKLKNLLGGRAHLEVSLGSRIKNIEYCSKEGDNNIIIKKIPENLREISEASLDKIKKAAQLLKDIREMSTEEFVANHPGFYLNNKPKYLDHKHEAIVKQYQTWNGDLKSKNFWICGAPGVGKSRLARHGLNHYEMFSKPFNKWWNGFDPEKTKRVIIDDWPDMDHGGDMLVQHLKIWADRYPFTAEVKGSHLAIMPKFQLVITSNYSIDECFKNEKDREAIKRRITEHIMFGDATLDSHLQLPIPE